MILNSFNFILNVLFSAQDYFLKFHIYSIELELSIPHQDQGGIFDFYEKNQNVIEDQEEANNIDSDSKDLDFYSENSLNQIKLDINMFLEAIEI